MNALLKRHMPFVCGALVMLMLAALLVKLRYDLELNLETGRVHAMLDSVGSGLVEELERGAQNLGAAQVRNALGDPWQEWQLSADGYVGRGGKAPRIAEAELIRALESAKALGRRPALLGPFAAPGVGNVIAIAFPGYDAAGKPNWSGASVPVDEILPRPMVAQLMEEGYRLQLFDATRATALYQSDEGGIDSPVTTEIPFRGWRLQWHAAPRAGWAAPPKAMSSSLFVVLALLLWLAFEFRRDRLLRNAVDDLAEAEARRKGINTLYGNAIAGMSALESRLHIVSMYDKVTGLANRSSLVRRIETALADMRQSPHGHTCVLAIGFDHVSHISHSFGMEFSSRVLVVAAERVEFVLPSKDLLFRIGEFQLAVVVPQADPAIGRQIAEAIIKEVESPIALDGHTFMLHPRIGIAETVSGYEYAETLLDRANMALDAVQRDATPRYCLFDSSTAKESVSRLQLEADLNRAFDDDQFTLEYMPIVAPATNDLAGFEALIRWSHPTEGPIPPSRFVPLAVQAGLSHRLNSWVMREASRQAAAWWQAGHHTLFVSVKLSADAFLKPDLVDEIAELLAEYGLPGRCLLLELTESALIQDISGASRTLQRLRELEIRTWLGNFGTGYSSLSYLRALPLNGVKIDRSFVERSATDARDFGFLKSLIDLISYLGMQSIAEGIETREQYELLSLTTCDLYQGNYFSRCLTAARAEQWIRGRAEELKRGMHA